MGKFAPLDPVVCEHVKHGDLFDGERWHVCDPSCARSIETRGKITPRLSVNGDYAPDGAFLPTGVAFDARPDGWRVSCLNGVTPRFKPGDRGAMRLLCGSPAGEL